MVMLYPKITGQTLAGVVDEIYRSHYKSEGLIDDYWDAVHFYSERAVEEA